MCPVGGQIGDEEADVWLIGDGEAGMGLIGGQVGDGQAKMVSWEKDRK